MSFPADLDRSLPQSPLPATGGEGVSSPRPAATPLCDYRLATTGCSGRRMRQRAFW